MTNRSRSILPVLLAAMTVTSAASAGELISPSTVLAAKAPHRGPGGFSDRTARISSIMGPELSRSAPMQRYGRKSAIRRDADASVGLR